MCCGLGVCGMGSAEFLDRMWRPPTSIPTIPTQSWPTAAPVHIWSGQEHAAAERAATSLLFPVCNSKWN